MRILIVDDLPINLKLLRAMLEAESVEVLEASNGAEALALLERGPKIDAIISDILMPKMDGYEFCSRIRKHHAFHGIPFLFATSTYTSPSDEKYALELGADRFFKKPVAVAEILKAIEEIRGSGGRRKRTPSLSEGAVLREYSDRLVAKLEEKNAELEGLTVQLRKLSKAVEQTADTIIITDEKGVIQYVNPAFERLTGYSTAEVLGKTPRILKSGELPASFYAILWQTITGGRAFRDVFVNRKKNGALYYEELSISPIVDDRGAITHFVSSGRDVTDQKRLEDQLRQVAKLESIGTLAGGIAHDFNNILGIILGYVTLLQSRRPAEAAPMPELEAIESAVQRGTTLVQQILTFARKSEVALAPVRLNDIVQELARMAVETFPRTIAIVTHLDPAIPIIYADATQIHQALLNLCVNARDAILDAKNTGLTSGRISIRTALLGKEEIQGLFPEAATPAYVALSVSDTGVGMDELTRNRVFEPFFTTKEQGKGTGLGLAVVYGTVQSHHGFINVQSRVGQGSTFTLYFPTPAASASGGARMVEAGEVPGGTETILVVEDEEPLLQLVKLFMERKGYRVLVAHDGEEAVEAFARHAREIALVVSDYGLPRLSGIDSLRKMREVKANVRMILVSGYVEPKQRTEMLGSGVTEIIQKPYVFDEIMRKVREVLDRP